MTPFCCLDLYLHEDVSDTSSVSLAVGVAISMGCLMNLERVTNIYACQELEQYATGCAGILGNVMNAAHIPLVSFYAFLLYGQRMTPLELTGGATVMLALLLVPTIKVWKQKNNEITDEKRKTEKLRKPLMEDSSFPLISMTEKKDAVASDSQS